jgi:hypothetical protein
MGRSQSRVLLTLGMLNLCFLVHNYVFCDAWQFFVQVLTIASVNLLIRFANFFFFFFIAVLQFDMHLGSCDIRV